MSAPSDTIVFVPACLLCPSYMAKSNKEETQWRKIILSYLTENDYSIIPLPCPEASFSHPKAGLRRTPHTIRFYEKLEGFPEYCAILAEQAAKQIEELTANGFKVDAILGLENSPTCSVDRMFIWGEGSVKKRGIFIEKLTAALRIRDIIIPFLGINRRKAEKTIFEINEIVRRQY